MFILSAFADEIGPEPLEQIDLLDKAGVKHIEFRSIHATNVLALGDRQLADFKALLDKRGFKLSAIGSPIGKIKIDEPFEPHLERFRRAIHLCRVFGVKNIRIFSYYLPAGETWGKWRGEVMSRMLEKAKIAMKEGVRLLHENEHGIFGDDPARVVDLMQTVLKEVPLDNFAAIYDPANYVHCGYDPWQGWELTRQWTVHFHIKDWVKGETKARLPGAGAGRIPDVIADAVRRNYDGFATLEPHMLGGGPTGGVTGPELFPKAIAAFQKIVEKAGGRYR
ncbi:MAG: sugar phosphate isomerase/epimerase family protein [Pirellulaceae bacterium]